jgi:hypothetical protein
MEPSGSGAPSIEAKPRTLASLPVAQLGDELAIELELLGLVRCERCQSGRDRVADRRLSRPGCCTDTRARYRCLGALIARGWRESSARPVDADIIALERRF